MKFEDVILENINCPMGCEPDDELILKGRDLINKIDGEFSLIKCRSCGLMRTSPRPTPETIGFYYNADYSPWQTSLTSENKKKSFTRILNAIVKKLIIGETYATKIPNIKHGRMLEIGCASGAYMHSMALKGWEVSGIEYSELAAKNAIDMGYSVYVGQLETALEPEVPYDIIVGWHVIEHLHEPAKVLKQMLNWVKPGGYAVVSMPNSNSLGYKIFKKYWYALQLPTHLFHYSPDTITSIFEKAGWQVEKIYCQRNIATIFGSLGYLLSEKLGCSNKVADFLKNVPDHHPKFSYIFTPLARLLAWFGLTSRMTIWARRKIDS